MNFTEFSFWWFLLIIGVPAFTLRSISKKLEFWPDNADAYLLALLSLSLFWNAARDSFLIFALEITFNYLAVQIMLRLPINKAKYLALGIIVLDLGILAYYKYINFFLGELLEPILLALNWDGLWSISNIYQQSLEGARIPPGISFYTFQMVGFVVDSLKGPSRKPINFVDYVNFASFFPQVVAGPIERRTDLLPQLQRFRFRFTTINFSSGIPWLMAGLFMKLVLADNIASYILVEESENAWLIWLSIISFGFRIYFDFAGYSLIALGIAKVIGIDLTLNFRSPYIAANIQDFWRRWHITLSTWFRDYLYIPLGGSRVKWGALNLLTVFAVSGLWHGAGWNFVLWGTYHGLLLVGHRYSKGILTLPILISCLLTNVSVFLGWLFFMDSDFNRILAKLSTMVTPSSYGIQMARGAWRTFTDVEQGSLFIVMALIGTVLISEYVCDRSKYPDPYYLLRTNWMTPCLIAAIILLAARTSTEFIYFAF